MSDFEEFKQAEKSGWEAQGGRYHLGVEKFTTIAAPALLEMAQVGEGAVGVVDYSVVRVVLGRFR